MRGWGACYDVRLVLHYNLFVFKTSYWRLDRPQITSSEDKHIVCKKRMGFVTDIPYKGCHLRAGVVTSWVENAPGVDTSWVVDGGGEIKIRN